MAKKTKYKNYTASSFWLDRDFDVNFKSSTHGIDYTKLAAAQRAIGNFVNIVTGKQIPVTFQSNDSSYTDGERVVIGTKLEDANFDPAVGLALHEGSHIAYTDFSLFNAQGSKHKTSALNDTEFAYQIRLTGLDPDLVWTNSQFSIIKDLLNWIEDRRIDYHVYTQAPGYRMYYEAMYNKYFEDPIIDKALKLGSKNDETLDCYMFHIINFTNVNRNLSALKHLQTIWNIIDLKAIGRLANTTDALKLACDVYRVLENIIDKQLQDEVNNVFNQHGLGNDDNESNEGDSNSSTDSPNESTTNGSGSGGSQSGSSPNDLTDKELSKLEKAIKNQKEFVDGAVSKTGRLSKTQSRLVNAMRESGTDAVDVATDAAGTGNFVNAIVVRKLTPAIICSMPDLFANESASHINTGACSYSSNTSRINEGDAAVQRGLILGKQLGNKLQLRNSAKTLKSTRLQAGKIDRRLVSQLGYDNVNVFHRIVTDQFKNYFIHISIDASGSMSGQKFRQAITSAVAIAKAASMTTGIRVQISLRGTNSSMADMEKCVTVYAYDSAHDKITKIRSLFKYLDVFGCTPEGLSFKSILKDLKKDARGDELIFINYSDGQPTNVRGTSYDYNGIEFTKKVVNEMRDNGISILSYFIYDSYMYDDDKSAFTRMYGPDSKFIRPDSMTDVSKTINAKFLELTEI